MRLQALKSPKGSWKREMRRDTAAGKIKKKAENESVAWRVSGGGELMRVVRRQWLKAVRRRLDGVCRWYSLRIPKWIRD